MRLNAYFKNAVIYNFGVQIDVLKGEEFTLLMQTDTDDPNLSQVDVFANNDPVLSFIRQGDQVNFKADNEGVSEVKFMLEDNVRKKIMIRIVSSVSLPTARLDVDVNIENK